MPSSKGGIPKSCVEHPTMLKVYGVLGSTPTLVYTRSGTPISNFSIAHNIGVRGAPGSKTIWFRCVAFGDIAVYISKNYRKGETLQVTNATPDQEEYKGKFTTRWKVWDIDDEGWEKIACSGAGMPDDDEPY